MTHRPFANPASRLSSQAAGLVILAVATAALGGCNWIGWTAHAIGGDQVKKVNIMAQYRGLENQSVAVLVAADQRTLYQYPGADRNMTRALSSRIARDVAGSQLLDPDQIMAFKRLNPYWNTTPYAELAQQLGVSRVVIVDVVEYATRERGNAHVWQGSAVANIGVAEADGDRPDDFAYATTVRVVYPPDRSVGLLDSDDATIQLGLLSELSQRVSDLFHTHEIQQRQ